MASTITSFLKIDEQAEAAMVVYTSLINNLEITEIRKFTSGKPGNEGSVIQAKFTLNGQELSVY